MNTKEEKINFPYGIIYLSNIPAEMKFEPQDYLRSNYKMSSTNKIGRKSVGILMQNVPRARLPFGALGAEFLPHQDGFLTLEVGHSTELGKNFAGLNASSAQIVFDSIASKLDESCLGAGKLSIIYAREHPESTSPKVLMILSELLITILCTDPEEITDDFINKHVMLKIKNGL